MKLLLITFILSLGFHAHAGEWYMQGYNEKAIPESLHCEDDAKVFSKHMSVDTRCFFPALTHANYKQQVETSKEDFFVVGYKNALFIAEKIKQKTGFAVKRRVIAGVKSTLKEIQSVAISSDHKYIMVLDRGAAKIFHLKRHGNIGPTKLIKHDLFTTVDRLSFHANKKDIIGISSDQSSLVMFSMQLDSRQPAHVSRIKPKTILKGENTNLNAPVDVSFSEEHKKMYVLDSGSSEILVFPYAASGDIAPVRKITSTKLYRPQTLVYSKELKQLVIVNTDKSVVYLDN